MIIRANSMSSSRHGGFSLIEVLVAVVVLATGLLALAALQSALVRSSADARARSQVAAFVDSVIERQRAFDRSPADFNALPSTALWTTNELATVENNAGISGFAVSVGSTLYDGRSGAFVVAASGATFGKDDPRYKELRVVATWKDALGQARRYDLATILSPRNTGSQVPLQSPTGPPSSSNPIVRTLSPIEPGVIPIAIGDSSDTAATNPRPTINSGNVIRTSYEVLTYRNEGSGNTVKQQRRVETAVIGCSCQRGLAPTGILDGTAQWPAYWNGERYVVYTPTDKAPGPGAAVNAGPANPSGDDPLCTECCRDHHDDTDATHVKFDPYRTDSPAHYKLVGSDLMLAGTTDVYLEACRMIRVDGFWRTAQDMDLKHFGLLETADSARSPAPASNLDPPGAVERYEQFVIGFLKSKYLPGQVARLAETVYAEKQLNLIPASSPNAIVINRPTPQDERYLHARGLYVDKVEADAQAKIDQAAASCTRTNPEECILPYLAFTSINVTEAAFWSAPAGKLTVDSDGFVLFKPSAPNRGRVNALSSASGLADVEARIQKSNSGVAVRDRGVDPGDDIDATDAQTFDIGGGSGGTSGVFTVTLSGLPIVQKSPGVSWAIGTQNGNCQQTYNCTTTVALGGSVQVTVGAYNQEQDITGTRPVICPNSPSSDTTPSAQTYTTNGQKRIRICNNYKVSSASKKALDGTIVDVTSGIRSPDRDGRVGDLQTGAGSEATTIDFNSVANDDAITLGFSFEGETVAPILSCTFKTNGNLSAVTFDHCP